jgi:hypothetical protein
MTSRLSLLVLVAFCCAPLPALAYGDPTGGALFQTLGPLLAVVWGLWMILANSIRKRLTNLKRRVRGIREPEPPPLP